MRKSRIKPGMRFGKLVVIEKVGTDRDLNSLYNCLCDCGKETVKRGLHLLSGSITSCICSRPRKGEKRKHGLARSSIYKPFRGMILRCNNPKAINYNNYGGRGIIICERWSGENGINNFLEDMGNRPEGHSLDRINPDGNYEPSNCRWVTFRNQTLNRTKNVFCRDLIYNYGKGFSFDIGS